MEKLTLPWGEVTPDGEQEMNVPLVCFSFPLYEILGEWVNLRSLSQTLHCYLPGSSSLYSQDPPSGSNTRGSDGQGSTVTIVSPGPCPGGPNSGKPTADSAAQIYPTSFS